MQHGYGDISDQRESSLRVQIKKVVPRAMFVSRSGGFGVVFVIARSADKSLLESVGKIYS